MRIILADATRGNARLAKRIVYFLALFSASWCVMTFTHEVGHIIGGWYSGGTLITADLLPWHLPYSIFNPNPMPLVTLWSGPILGVLIPLATAVVIRRESSWFVANFCLLANGTYIALAWSSSDQYLDTPQLLENGAHPVTILGYCVLTIGFGYIGFRQSCNFILSRPDAVAKNK